MEQQHRRVASADFLRLIKPAHTRRCSKAVADQEVAIARHEKQLRAAVGELSQRGANLRIEWISQIIITNPGIKQVAQNEQGADLDLGGVGKKGKKARRNIGARGIQVQIRDKAGSASDV